MPNLLANFDVTIIIIIITVIVSMLAWQSESLLNRLIFYPPAINQGQWYRMLTHGFIHADSAHLLFNMFTLYFFGRAVEQLYDIFLGELNFGGLGFVLFYLTSIIAAMIPSYLVNKHNRRYFSLGASGGVMAVLFAYILVFPWNTLYLFGLLPVPAILLAIAYVAYSIYAHKKGGSKVNHLAHLWGGVFGVVATIAIEPAVVPHFFAALLSPNFQAF